MRTIRLAAGVVVLGFAVSAAEAADVTIRDVHLCCGACVQGANKALAGLNGISKAACDLNAKVVSFQAQDAKSADLALKSLAKAGFFGSATHGGQKIPFPSSGAKKGTKADTLTLRGVHLCCANCVKLAHESLVKVRGVTSMEIDAKQRTIRLFGKQIDEMGAIEALNTGGFFATILRPKPKASKPSS